MNSTLGALDVKAAFGSGKFSVIIDYLQQAGALNALLLGVFGTTAWFVNKYFGLQYWLHVKDTETIEYLFAVKTEIKLNTTSFARNFTPESLEQAKTNAKTMATSRKRQPMIISEAGENAVYDSLKSKLTVLPTDLIEPIVGYYTLEAEFSASYNSLASPVLAKRSIEITLSVIDATHNDAQACIDNGRNIVKMIDQQISRLKESRSRRLVLNILCASLISGTLLATVTW